MSPEDEPSPCLLDASAALAFVQRERGAEVVESRLLSSSISVVNWAEVAGKLAWRGDNPFLARRRLQDLGLEVLELTILEAELAGILVPRTARLGLSLGDRICLATAITRGLPILTADRAWASVPLDVEVELIR